jgi:hypothetical protein
MLGILTPIKKAWWSYNSRADAKKERAQQLAAMVASSSERTRDLGRLLEDVASRKLSDRERRLFDQIEALREELVSSNETIEFKDFGAGEPGDNLSKEQMETGRVRTRGLRLLCEQTSHTYPWTHLMTKLAGRSDSGYCLELGTCIGIGASYMLAGLSFRGKGRLVTLEGAESFAKIAKRNFARLDLWNHDVVVGRFQDTLDKVLATRTPIHFAYIDGHHDGEATVGYFHTIAKAMGDDGLLLFDDIRNYESMRNAWQTICAHSRSQLVVDLGDMGIIGLRTSGQKESFKSRVRPQ